MGASHPDHWSIERRIGYPAISDVALSPISESVVYVVSEPRLTDDKSEFVTHVYVATEGSEPRQLTFGEASDSAPRWSPDGRSIAFLSRRSGRANVYVMAADGGEAWPLTRFATTDVTALKWAPDGKTIGFLMAEPPSDAKEKARKAKDDAVRVDVDLDFTHLWSVPVDAGPRLAPDVRQLTKGRFQVAGFDWLPDGQSIAITYQPTTSEDSWTETRLAIVSANGVDGSLSESSPVIASFAGPLASPDGKWIACFTSDRPVHWGYAGRMTLYPVAGGEPRSLAYTPDGASWPIGWSAESDAVLVLEEAGVTTQIWSLPVSGDPGWLLTDSRMLKSGCTVNARGRVAFVGQDTDQPNAVYRLNADGSPRLIARPPLPADWPAGQLPSTEVIRWTAPDGMTIEGIVVFPLDYQAGRRCPLIVCVHGGPTGVFQRSFLAAASVYPDFASAVSLAERGFAILLPNARGSGGYGSAFRQANYGDWGGGDYRDVMSGVDHLIAQGVADPERLGVLGWSYGGYLTSWIISQTNRFKAACVGAGVTNLVSMTGTTDIPSFLPDYFGAELRENLDVYVRRSPVLQARNVTTPTLIVHGDADVRVPLSQGRELYNALKRQGVEVELVVYPREGHVVVEPRHVIDLSRRTVEWLVGHILDP
jgi:dipeptidyl aminopeptidase/acylaminoacyl peptidase